MQKLARLGYTLSQPQRPLVPLIHLKGFINRQLASQVDYLLGKIPKKSKKLAVVINTNGGQFSQALIIANKLKGKAKQNNMQLITFGEEYVLNSGFFILMSGDKIYTDETTIIGGLQNGQSKVINKIIPSYVQSISYSNQISHVSEMKSDVFYDEEKGRELKTIFEDFSQEAKRRIEGSRKIGQDVNLFNFYFGKQAVEKEIIDGIGRVYQTIPRMVPNANIELVKISNVDKLKDNLKKIDLLW